MNAKIKAALLGDATAAAECTAAGIAQEEGEQS